MLKRNRPRREGQPCVWHCRASRLSPPLLVAVTFAHAALAQGLGTRRRTASSTPAAAPRPAAPAAPARRPPAPAAASRSPPLRCNCTRSATPSAPSAPGPGEPSVSSADLPEDLSPWGMFKAADIIVKGVIIGLAFASLVTWTVWLAKTLELRTARSEVAATCASSTVRRRSPRRTNNCATAPARWRN